METREKTCTVWVDKYVKGWDGVDEAPEFHPTLPIADALADCYTGDAHIVPYHVEVQTADGWKRLEKAPRMTNASIKVIDTHNARVRFDLGVADVDCAESHRDKVPAPTEWRERMRALAEAVVPGCWHYDTKGGLRILWTWAEPLSPEEHSAKMAQAIATLRAAGIPADDLTDATRCFRAPFVVREGEAQWPHTHFPVGGPAIWESSGSPEFSGFGVSEPENPQKSPWDGIENIRDKFVLPDEMDEGTRHNTLKRYAASLRAKGAERDEIEVKLREYEAKAGAKLRQYQGTADGERDLLGIIDWVCALPAGPSYTPPVRSSASAAAANLKIDNFTVPPQAYEKMLERGDSFECAHWTLAQIESDGVACIYALGELWRWVPKLGRYVEIPKTQLARLIGSMAGMWVMGRMTKNGPQLSPLKLSGATVNDIVRVIHTLRDPEKPVFVRCEGVSFADCFVRVSANGVEKLAHDPKWACNIGFDDAWTDDDPIEWLKFLDEVLADLSPTDRQVQIETIGEWMGAMLTRQSTKFQVSMVLNGGGSNGKSQFVVVVEGVVPSQRVTHFAPQNLGSEYNRAKLAKAILNSTAEVPSTEIGDTVAATLKALISGEPMTGRFPYENPFDFVPEAAVLLAANNLPVVRDYTKGMWRRVKVIDFNQEFSGPNMVRNLGEKILSAERVKIACWALRQLPNLITRGEYRDTQANLAAKARWQSASDDVEQWIADAIDQCQQPNGTPCEPLYQSYRIWAESAGISAGSILTKRKFFDRLKSKYKPFTAGPSTARRVEYPLKIRESMSTVH